MLDFSRRRIRETVGVSACPEPSPNLSREITGEGPECISRGGEFWVIVALPFLGGACVGGRALDDLIVVEFAQMVSGPMCGKMFADMLIAKL